MKPNKPTAKARKPKSPFKLTGFFENWYGTTLCIPLDPSSVAALREKIAISVRSDFFKDLPVPAPDRKPGQAYVQIADAVLAALGIKQKKGRK